MKAIGDLVAQFWARDMQKELIAILNGVFGTIPEVKPRHNCSKYPKVLLALVFQPSQPKLLLPFPHE